MRKTFLHILFFVSCAGTYAQNSLQVVLRTHETDCQLSAAGVTVWGGDAPYTINWSHGASGDTVSSLTPGNYYVQVIDNGTPHDTVLIGFTIDKPVCKVTFGNRFTPNGDGINELWTAGKYIVEYPNFLLQVFDRWGQLVHQQRNTFTPWDGTHLGIKLPDATYYWIFFYEEDKKKIEKGSLTIIR